MKRRTFLASAGSTSIGASALIASGAFSRVESDRAVSIAVAEDADAYLGLDKCRPDGENPTPNASYAWPDDKGHLRIFMDDKNPTIGESPLGEGINSNSTSIFDRVFQICNQGKETVCVWIEDDEEWPKYDGDRRVDFYLEDTRDESIIGEEYGVELEVGQCVCVGISVRSHGLEEGDTVLDALDDQITIVADVDGVCGRVPPEDDNGDEDDCIDCTDRDENDRLTQIELQNTGDEKVITVQQLESGPHGGTLFGPSTVASAGTFEFDIDPGQPELLFFVGESADNPIPINHADDNYDEDGEFHISCSQTVRTGDPLYRDDESEPGNDLVILAALDNSGNKIC